MHLIATHKNSSILLGEDVWREQLCKVLVLFTQHKLSGVLEPVFESKLLVSSQFVKFRVIRRFN